MSSSTELFSLLNGWEMPHTERHIAQTSSTVHLLDLHLALPYDINSFALSKYCRQHIRDRNMGFLTSPIRLPFLLKQTAADNKESVDIFQMILQYLSDDSGLSEDRRRLLGSFIIQKGLTSQNMRDEIFVQLCNETMSDNKKYEQQTTRAWHLLALCLSTFQPSKDLAKHLLKYVSDSKTSNDYNVVCQQKLLQCVDIEPKLNRIYPPTLLEWETTKRKACMALATNFYDGEKVLGHVESWTTGESFAANLLHSRGFGNGLSGWTVTLRDDGDIYECAGYDYVMDFVGEIEVPPMFPCSAAYYLTTCGLTKSNRHHYNDQPHTADRPRLMPLDVHEHSESLSPAISATRPLAPIMPPPPPRPRTPTPPPQSPVISSPAASSPAPSPKPPTPVPVVHEEMKKPAGEFYALNNEALSLESALNRRQDVLPENLSSTSVLNSRYNQVAQAPLQRQPSRARQQPPSPQLRSKPSMKAPRPVSQPRPEPPRVPRDPLRLRGAVQPNQSEEDNLEFIVDSVFSGLDNDLDDLMDPQRMSDLIKGGVDDPKNTEKQTSSDLETQLKTKLLEVELLQKSIEVDKYKQELEQLKQMTQAPPHVNGTTAAANNKQAPPTKPKTTAVQPMAPPAAAAAARNVAPPPTVGTHAAVTTAAAAAGAAKQAKLNTPAAAFSIPPPPPLAALPHDVNPKHDESGAKIQNGVRENLAVETEGVKPEVVKATPAGGTYHKTPQKIGAIRWPPPSDKEETEAPKPAPGKIVIDEKVEESIIVVAKQTPEEAQRKIAEKINASRIKHEQEDALRLAEKNKSKTRRPRAPVTSAAATAAVVASNNLSDESDYDDTLSESTLNQSIQIDMAARQKALAEQLKENNYFGSVHRTGVPPVAPPLPPAPLLSEPPTAPTTTTVVTETSADVRRIEPDKPFDIHAMDNLHTVLYAQIAEPFYTYQRVPWTFEVRKEVFSPAEELENPNLIHLVFAQVVQDVLSNDSIRLGKDDRSNINKILDANGIHTRNVAAQNHRLETKLAVIKAAKEAPFYFCRMYPVNGGSRHVNLHLLGVSHSGVRLITRCKDAHDDYLTTIDHIQFNEILDVTVPKPCTVLIRQARKSVVVYSYMASGIMNFIKSYKDEADKSKWQQR